MPTILGSWKSTTTPAYIMYNRVRLYYEYTQSPSTGITTVTGNVSIDSYWDGSGTRTFSLRSCTITGGGSTTNLPNVSATSRGGGSTTNYATTLIGSFGFSSSATTITTMAINVELKTSATVVLTTAATLNTAITLPAIDRAPTWTMSPTSCDVGTTVTVTPTRRWARQKLRLTVNGQVVQEIDGNWQTATFAAPDMSYVLPNGGDVSAAVSLEYYDDDSNLLGTLRKTLTVHVYGQPSTISATNITAPGTINVSISRKATGATHTLQVSVNGGSYTTLFSNSSATSYSYSVGDIQSTYPNLSSVPYRFRVYSYQDGHALGNKIATSTVSINSAYKPSVSNIALSETSTGVGNIELSSGKFLAYKSLIQVIATNTPLGSGNVATVSSASFTMSAGSSQTITSSSHTSTTATGVFTATPASNGTISATITDTRGRVSDSVSTPITVLPYTNPQITVDMKRYTDAGVEDILGEKIKMTSTVSCQSIIDSTEKNQLVSCSWIIKDEDGVTVGSGSQSFTTGQITKTFETGYFNNEQEKKYVATVTVTDKVGTETTNYFELSRTIVPLSLYDDADGNVGASFGTMAQGPWIEFAKGMNMRATSDDGSSVVTKSAYDVVSGSSFETGTSGIWTWIKYDNGISMCWSTQSMSAAITQSQGSGIYRNASALGASNFPTGLFLSTPLIFDDVRNTSTATWGGSANGYSASRYGGLFVYHIGSGTYTVMINVLAIGRWK